MRRLTRKIYPNNFLHNTIKYFDVSLRDGLQSLPKVYKLNEKIKMLQDIVIRHKPNSIEVGSIVSDKILPQMKDSVKLLKYAEATYTDIDFYILTPNIKACEIAKKNNIKNISVITSVSNDFQLKNINKSLKETKDTIEYLINNNYFNKIKLYISCINFCPVKQKIIDNKFIINEINYYYKMNIFNELCLSDTYGNLLFSDFKYILDNIIHDIPVDKLSIHLHISQDNISNITKIIRYALSKNIFNFDISYLDDTGGCSVTINSNNLKSNLSYNFMEKYIL